MPINFLLLRREFPRTTEKALIYLKHKGAKNKNNLAYIGERCNLLIQTYGDGAAGAPGGASVESPTPLAAGARQRNLACFLLVPSAWLTWGADFKLLSTGLSWYSSSTALLRKSKLKSKSVESGQWLFFYSRPCLSPGSREAQSGIRLHFSRPITWPLHGRRQ